MPDDVSPRVAVLIFTLMGLGSCALGAAVYRWWKGGTFLDYEPRRPVPWNGWDVGGVFFFWLIAMIAASAAPLLIARGWPGADLPRLSLISQCAASVAIVLLAAALLSLRGASMSDLGLRLDRAGDDLFVGVAAFFVVLVPVYGLMIVLGLLFPEAAKHPLVELLKERPELV